MIPRKETTMDPIKVTLCPACGGCPTVEITDDGVAIGEKNNTAHLTYAEWNALVAYVKRGELHEV
jgi:formate dehydrogenase maturation protein FdhE